MKLEEAEIKSATQEVVFETPLLNCYMGEDDILYSESKIAERTIENYKLLFDVYKEISLNGTKKIRTLGNITKTRPMTIEVRNFISEELPKYIKAMALISDSVLGRILGNFFLKLKPPSYPAKIFNTRTEAIKWLKQY